MIRQPTPTDFTIIANEIYKSVIHLQSVFTNTNYRGSLFIDDSYRSNRNVFQQFLVLRDLFKKYREYSQLESSLPNNSSPEKFKLNHLNNYFRQLFEFWQENRNVTITNRNADLLKETKEALNRIIQANRNREEEGPKTHNLQIQLQQLHEDNNKKAIRIGVLEMENDALKRRQNRDRDVKNLQLTLEQIQKEKEKIDQKLSEQEQKNFFFKNDNDRLSLQIANYKKIIDDLQQQLARIQKNEPSIKVQKELEDLREQNRKNILKIKRLEEENKQLQQQDQKKEDPKLMKDYQKALEENRILSAKIDELYEQLDLKKQNEQENRIKELEYQLNKLTHTIQKLNDEKKLQGIQIDNLKQQLSEQNIQQESPVVVIEEKPSDNWSPGIKFLPELNQGSHLAPVIIVLHHINGFPQLLEKGEDNVIVSLRRIMAVINGNPDQSELLNDAEVIASIQGDIQNDNRANDLLFQIIDYLSKFLTKEEEQKSEIAKIISAPDSPIFDMFFFLQRIYKLEEEIQEKEIPLINSIKQIRAIPELIKSSERFSTYLTKLSQMEGTDNGGNSFNYVIFPQVIIFNVYELSNARANLQIDMEISSKNLNLDETYPNEFKYRLTGIVHSAVGNINQNQADILYYLTINYEDKWLQVLQQQYIIISNINEILSFKRKYNDKELLIYQRV